MIKRYVRRATAEGCYAGAVPEERTRAWTKNFPPNVARRMTRLGLMLGELLREFSIEPADAVVYASTYGETIATERYLDGFPSASPLFFQTSIHPSAIEQVLINRGCPVRELTPLAGETHLGAQAALTALLTPGERVILTGGEEIGTWLKDLDAASEVAFAFALELTQSPSGAIGALEWREGAETAAESNAAANAETEEQASGAEKSADLEEWFRAIHERQPLRCPSPAGGEIGLTWH